jgi:hypothetical protein
MNHAAKLAATSAAQAIALGVLEGRPVCLGGVSLVGLSFEDANELVDVLNRQDLEIERQARRLVSEAMRPRSPGLTSPPMRQS